MRHDMTFTTRKRWSQKNVTRVTRAGNEAVTDNRRPRVGCRRAWTGGLVMEGHTGVSQSTRDLRHRLSWSIHRHRNGPCCMLSARFEVQRRLRDCDLQRPRRLRGGSEWVGLARGEGEGCARAGWSSVGASKGLLRASARVDRLTMHAI